MAEGKTDNVKARKHLQEIVLAESKKNIEAVDIHRKKRTNADAVLTSIVSREGFEVAVLMCRF